MSNPQHTDHLAWIHMEAERAFGQTARARRRASITHRLLRRGVDCALGVWIAEHTGAGLPPIDVVQIGNSYAIRDGQHRVSVARARGAVTIDAIVA